MSLNNFGFTDDRGRPRFSKTRVARCNEKLDIEDDVEIQKERAEIISDMARWFPAESRRHSEAPNFRCRTGNEHITARACSEDFPTPEVWRFTSVFGTRTVPFFRFSR